MSCELPKPALCRELESVMRLNSLTFTEDDPGLILDLDDVGLQAHNPNSTPAASRNELVQTVLHAGMRAAQDSHGCASKVYFYGTAEAWVAAYNALGAIRWARYAPDLRDVGKLWSVWGSAASPQYAQLLMPFNL